MYDPYDDCDNDYPQDPYGPSHPYEAPHRPYPQDPYGPSPPYHPYDGPLWPTGVPAWPQWPENRSYD